MDPMARVLGQLAVPRLRQIVREKQLGKVTKVPRDGLIKMIINSEISLETVNQYLELDLGEKRLAKQAIVASQLRLRQKNIDAMQKFGIGVKVHWKTDNNGQYSHDGQHHFGVILKLTQGYALIARCEVERRVTTVSPPSTTYYTDIRPNWDRPDLEVRVECSDLDRYDPLIAYTFTQYER